MQTLSPSALFHLFQQPRTAPEVPTPPIIFSSTKDEEARFLTRWTPRRASQCMDERYDGRSTFSAPPLDAKDANRRCSGPAIAGKASGPAPTLWSRGPAAKTTWVSVPPDQNIRTTGTCRVQIGLFVHPPRMPSACPAAQPKSLLRLRRKEAAEVLPLDQQPLMGGRRKPFRAGVPVTGKEPSFCFARTLFAWQNSTVGVNPSRSFHKRSRQPRQPVEKVPWPRGPGLRGRARRADGGDAQAHRQGDATPPDGCKSGPPGGLRRFSRRSSLDDGGQTALGYALVVRLLRRENRSQRGSRDFFNRLLAEVLA